MPLFHWPPRWWPWQPKPPQPPPPPPVPPPIPPDDVVQQLLAAHNEQRSRDGLGPLNLDPKLQRMARSHSATMANNGKMSHDWAGDGSYDDRLAQSGYHSRMAGENVAWDQQDVSQVMAAWMNSAGHRSNILGDFVDCGLAMVRGAAGDPYWCAEFGSPSQTDRLTLAPTEPAGPDEPYRRGEYGYLVDHKYTDTCFNTGPE